MDLILNRTRTGPDGTFGTLCWNGNQLATLEKPWLDNQPEISCIPAGTYELLINYSPHFDYPTPILIDVPGRTQIRIHPANWQTQLQGCIAVGEREAVLNGTEGLADSKAAFDALMGDMNKTRSSRITLVISDCWKSAA